MSKFSDEEVTVRNEFFDQIGAGYQTIGKHDWKGDKGKDSWWIFRYKDKIEQASKLYFARKAELAEEVAKKDAEGNPVRSGTGYDPDMTKLNKYEHDLKVASEVEVGLDLKKRFFVPKDIPALNPDEWKVVWPYIANQSEVEAHMMKEADKE